MASFQGTFGWIYYEFVLSILHIPFRAQFYQPIEISLFEFRIQSSLVERVKIMADVHKFCTTENSPISILFDIGADEPAHPVIGDNRGGKESKLPTSL